MSVLYLIVRYILLLAALAVWICLIVLTEGVYTSVMRMLLKKRDRNKYHKFIDFFRQDYGLSGQGYRKTVLFALSISFALLCSVFACIPSGAAVPVIENGGDLLQMLFSIIMSVGFVFVALEALNFSDKKYVFKKLLISVARLYIPLAACIVSIASYLETIGIAGDTFSLSLLISATPYNSMSKYGIAGLLLFGFIIFSQIYSEDKEPGEDCMLISVNDMPEFTGKTRFVLQLWSLFIPYLVILLKEQIFFPWKLFVRIDKGPLTALLMTLAAFGVFWAVLVLLRIVVVSLCWSVMHFIKTHVSKKVYFFILPLLVLIAMGLVFYDSIIIAAEMIAY